MMRKMLTIFSRTAVLALILAATSFAGTRIKTIEYSFGSYYSATNVASGAAWTPSSVNVYIPETTRTIRSAWLEFEGVLSTSANITGLDINFDAGASASTVRDPITGTYLFPTGEASRFYAKADVTTAITALTNQQYTASVTVTGPTINGHSLKLYITYEYDDTFSIQIKTVRFPLYYDVNIAAATSALGAQTKAYSYRADIADSNVVVRQQWFEVRGYRQSGGSTTDGSLNVKITGQGSGSSTYILDGGLKDSYDFKFLDHQGNTGLTGFTINSNQSLDITWTQNSLNMLSGECVVTYECDNNSATKTKTVRYILGQLVSGAGAGVSDNIYLEEEGVSVSRIYALIFGNYDNTTASNIVLDSAIGGFGVTQRAYSMVVTAAQVSGFSFLHDLSEQKVNFSSGDAVAITFGDNVRAGGYGVELIVTYNYTGESKAFTNSYSVLAGQAVNGISLSSDQTFSTWFPYWYSTNNGTLTLRNAGLRAEITQGTVSGGNSTTGDYTTTQGINSTSTQTVSHRTNTETHGDSVVYKNSGQITETTTSATANYSISTEAAAFGSVFHGTYSYFFPPKPPVSLAQYKADGSTVLTIGEYTNETTAVMKFTMDSPLASETLIPQVEIKPVGTSFTGTANFTGTGVAFSGSTVTGSVTVTLATGNVYHWQARVTGANGSSPWVSYPTSTPNAEAAADIGCDTTIPGVTNNQGGDNTWRAASGTTYNVDFTDAGGANLNYVQYSVYSATGQTGSQLITWTTIATNINAASYTTDWQVVYESLQQGTNYVSVRAYDNAGNTYSQNDVFYVKKDTSNPGMTNNQAGDNTWRSAAGTAYNVDFTDTTSLLNYAEYTVYSATGQTGSQLVTWTTIATNINAASYPTDWQVAYASLQQGTNYVSVRAYDNSGNTFSQNDVFYVKKDTRNPGVTNNQTGDNTWRAASGTTYNVDFTDAGGANLNYAQYAVYSATGLTGSQLVTWTTIATNINAASYTTDWQVAYASLQQGTNYVSVRAYDNAGNTYSQNDVFYVKKDTSNPGMTNNQAGDNTWRSAAGTAYNVDFTDTTSLLNYAEYTVYSATGQTGSQLVTWTTIATNINAASYPTDWQVAYASLQQGTNYVSVRAYDNSGNTFSQNDVFYVKKDTGNPGITNNQTGDDTWRAAAGTTYNVDFSDATSLLNYVQYTVYSATGQTGSQLATWTTIATNITAATYTADWQVVSASLQQGTNYVSVRAYDNTGNTLAQNDVFYVKKDTSNPGVTNNQTGDNTWRAASGTTYNVDFTDAGGANLNYAQYAVYSATGLTGSQLVTWTTIATNINAASYTTDWQVAYASLQQGSNYVSVRAYDNAGNTVSQNDVFYVNKDTGNPGVTNNQTGDDTWRAASGTTYNVDFSDATSLLNNVQYRVCAATGQTGTVLKDWTDIAAGINAATYTIDWQVDYASLQQGTNYVSVRAYDNSGNTVSQTDVFYVKKDTTAPGFTNNQTGDNTWRTSAGTSYDVDFTDASSLLNNVQYTVYSATGRTGSQFKDWTNIATGINSSSYSANWQGDYSSFQEGTN